MAGKHGYSFQQLKDAVLYGSTLNSGANDTQPAPLRPLRELAEDKEMCEEIARLLHGKFIESTYSSNYENRKSVDIQFTENLNRFKKTVTFYEDGYISFHESYIENAFQICTALCILINAHNADVGKLAEEYAYKMYPKADDHANVRMRQALRESLKDAVLYGSTLNWAKEKKAYEERIRELEEKNDRLYNQVSYLEK